MEEQCVNVTNSIRIKESKEMTLLEALVVYVWVLGYFFALGAEDFRVQREGKLRLSRLVYLLITWPHFLGKLFAQGRR